MTVTYPNVQKLVIDHLRTALADISGLTVGIGVPANRPLPLITVTREGGTAEWPAYESPRVTVRCWHTSEFNAEALAQRARTAILDMRGQNVAGTPVYDVAEFAGPTPLPDPGGSDTPMYLLSPELRIRGQ